MGFETAIYINEKVSHKNVKDFLDNVQDETRIEANVEFNTEKAIKALSKLTNIKNAKIEILPDGAVQSIKQVEVATGKIMTIRERIDEAGNREVQRMMMEIDADKEKLDLEKKQLEAKKEYSKLTSNLSKELSKQSKLQLELENTKGDAKTIVNEELKAQNKIVRSLQNKIKKHSEYNEEGEEYVNIQRQMVENENKLKKLKIQNSSNKQAQNYAAILKSQDKEYQLRKQMIKATGEEIVLLQQKVDKEKQIQLSAQQSIYGSRNVNKNMQEVVKANREIIEQNLSIAEAKERQARIDKQSTEAFNKLLALEKQRGQLLNASHGATGNTQNAYASQIQSIEQQIKQTESLIASEGLENSSKRLEVERQRKAIIDNIAIKEAQSTDKADEQEKTRQKEEQSRLYSEMLTAEKEITKLAKQRESISGQDDKKEQELELTRQISALEEKSAQFQEQINTQNLADTKQMLSIENERAKRANEIALAQSKANDTNNKVAKAKEENAQLKEQKRLYDELFKTEKQIANLSKQKARLGTGTGSEKQRVELEKQIVKLKQNSSVLEFKIQNAGLQHAEKMEQVEQDRLSLANQLRIIEAQGLDKLDDIAYQKEFNQLLQEQKDLYSQIHKAQADINNLTKKSETTSGEEQLEYQRQLVEAQQRYATVREEINSKNLVSIQEENKLIATQQQLENEMSVIIAKKADANKKQAEIKAEQDRKNAENERRLADETATYIELAKRKLNNRLKALENSSKGEFINPEEIEKVKQKIDSLNAIDLKSAKNEVQQLSQTITEMGTNARIEQVNKMESALGRLKQGLMSLPAQYISLQAAISATSQAFRNAAEYVGTVDSAWTNMSMTMSTLTRGDFDALVSKSSKLASNMGAVSTDVLAIAQTFANDGVEITDVVDKLEASTALMNVSGMNPQEVTSAVMSIANSFRLFEDGTMDVAEATEYLGNIITTVSANMDMDFQKGLQELISGIGTAGSTMKSAGVDMEWFVGTLGNLIVATGKSGTELARSMRTITARIFQQKQTLEEMGESTENLEIEMSNAEKALGQLGITIRGQASGELLPLSKIIDQIAQKWDGLSDSSRFFIAETMAGKNQMDTFIGMLDSYASSTKLVTEAQNSQGSLMQMNATYAESLEGRINTLKTAQNDLYQAMLSSDAYKSAIDSLTSILGIITDLVELLQGKFLAVTAGATVAVASFMQAMKGYTFKDQIKLLGMWIAEKVALTSATTVATTAVIAFKTALLGLGVGVAITAIGALVNAFKDARVEVGQLNDAVDDFNTKMTGHKESGEQIERYRELNHLLEQGGLSIEEQKTYQDELASVTQDLISKNETFKRILEDETTEYEKQYNALKNINDTVSTRDAIEGLQATNLSESQKSDLATRTNNLAGSILNNQELMTAEIEKQKALYDEMASAETTEKRRLQIQKEIEKSAELEAFYRSEMYDEYLLLQDGLDVLNNYNLANKLGTEAGVDHGRTDFQFDDIITQAEQAVTSVNKVDNAVEEVYDAVPEIAQKAYESVDDINARWVQSDEERVAAQKKANEDYVASLEALRQAKTVLQGLTDGDYTLDDMRSVMDSFPDFTGDINNAGDAINYVNDQIEALTQTAEDNYANMLAQDADLWSQKIANSDEWAEHVANSMENIHEINSAMLGADLEAFNEYLAQKGLGYEIDVSNAGNAAEAENIMQNQLVNQLLGYWGQFIAEKGGYREDDSVGIADFLNWQGVSEAQTITELKKLWVEYYNAKMKEIQATVTAFEGAVGDYGDLGNVTPEEMKAYQKAQQSLKKLQQLNSQMQGGSLFNSINTSFNNTVGKFGSGVNIGSITKPSSSGSGSGSNKGSSGSSKDTEKVVEDLELVIDRYYELNDALADVNNKLEMNRKLQDNTRDLATRKKLMEEEVELLKQQLETTEKLRLEQRNELLDNKNQLSRAGFKFDSEGNITNYATRLKEMQKYANSLSGDAKEAEIEYVKSIESIISTYTTLANSTLPSTEIELENLRHELENINKEHEKTLALIETLGDRYYDLESAIKKVDNALALNQAKQQNATGAERVRLMEEEIALMKEKQDLLKEQQSEVAKEAEEIAKKLAEQGVEFNKDGSVANYKTLMNNLKTSANLLVGDARDEAVESAQELIDLIEQYDALIKDTMPSLEVEWENYTNSIKEAEKTMAQTVTDIQKDITSAIQSELQKRTDAVKTELQKQKDAYNKQFEEEDWEDSLNSEQRKLDEIQQQINNLSRDTSLAGQLKLQQLREEYEAQQKVINDMIRDKEKENGNTRFDEEMEKLDQELEDALDPQNIADLVNKALVDGFVTIGDEVIALDTLMTDWLTETGDGLYAIGDILREEMIGNLRTAQELLAGMGITSLGTLGDIQSGSTLPQTEIAKATLEAGKQLTDQALSKLASVSIGSLLNIEGNLTEDLLPEVERMLESAKVEVVNEIAAELMRR